MDDEIEVLLVVAVDLDEMVAAAERAEALLCPSGIDLFDADKLVNVDVYYIIAIGKKYVLLGGACYKAHIRLESLDSAAVKALVARRGERRKNKHPLGLAGEVPRLACSEMVHKRLIVALCDNSDLFYAAVYHIGKRKVDKAVSACKRHAAHGAKPRHLAETLVIYV